MSALAGKRVLVTGGSGFLGRPLVERLARRGAIVFAPSRSDCDLTRLESVRRTFSDIAPGIVIHAAGFLGGIHFSRLYPADVFLKNLQMTCNLYEVLRDHRVEKLVNIGSACVYSDKLPGPFSEDSMLDLPMHPSVQYYGFSKLALYHGGMAFRAQFGLNAIHLVPANLYGPADRFDPALSHVVSSLIPKFYDARRQNSRSVTCWGTGSTVREFLYVDDCAEAIARATEVYDDPRPLNIGVGHGISIRELASLIGRLTGFQGEVLWDSSVPDGAAYKVIDTSRMRAALGWQPETSFEQGLRDTVAWFADHYDDWRTTHGKQGEETT